MSKDTATLALEALLTNIGVKIPSPYEKVDVEIERNGKKIVLPNDPKEMEIDDAIKNLERIKADEAQVFALQEVIDAHPYDALVAFNKAMRFLYGWTSPVPTPGFFGPKPPAMITVQLSADPKDAIQVPYGTFKIPSVEHNITVQFDRYKNRYALFVKGKARRVEKVFLLELVNKAREFIKTESIYRGKAVSAKSNGGELEQDLAFFDVAGASKNEVLLNDDVHDQIAVNLWAPIEHSDECRKHKIPLKRGILLEGIFGTGKSLTARITAKVCEDNGWTFLHIDNVEALGNALVFAEQYAPCVVFAEDIDRVLDERDDAANVIVNTLDGVLSKKAEVITVLTTNHVDKINPVMLRPGRLDAIITIDPPNAKTAERLIRLYGAGLISADTDLKPACDALSGQIPATIREVVERSKLAMLARGEKKVSGDALLIAAKGMTKHLSLLNKPKEEESDADAFWKLMKKVAGGGGGVDADELARDVNDNTDMEANRTRDYVQEKAGDIVSEVGGTIEQKHDDLIEKIEDDVVDALSAVRDEVNNVKTDVRAIRKAVDA